MILTGKCKEGFEKYIENLEIAPYVVMLGSIPKCYLNSLIIDYFDTLYFFIFIEKTYNEAEDEDKLTYTIDFPNDIIFSTWDNLYFNSRQEATEKAIEKANDLINKELTINL